MIFSNMHLEEFGTTEKINAVTIGDGRNVVRGLEDLASAMQQLNKCTDCPMCGTLRKPGSQRGTRDFPGWH